MASSYYPDSNDGRADWWANIVAVGTSTLGGLGFPTTQTTAINVDAQLGVYLYRTLPGTYEDIGKRVTGYIDTYLFEADGTPAPAIPIFPSWPAFTGGSPLAGIEARREKWVQQAKHAGSYDPAVQGAVLRVETAVTPFDPTTYAAEIFAAVCLASGTITSKFRKARGNIDAMRFFGHKFGASSWIDLGQFISTPATMTIPIATPGQPEEWQIKGRGVIGNTMIGLDSPILSVLVRG